MDWNQYHKVMNDIHNNVQNAMRNIPPIPPIPQIPGINWSPECPMASSSAASSSSSRPSIPKLPRDDEILVDVQSQSVKDSYHLKRLITLKSVSGSIKAKIAPSPTPTTELVRTLHTQTVSGSQHITISTSLGPFLMDSSHHTASGSIKVTYPDDWCGTIEITATGGSYEIRSNLEDTVVVRDVVDPSSKERHILALKGNPREGEEFSTMKIVTKTGSVQVNFEKATPLRDLTEDEIRREQEDAMRKNERSGGGPSGGRPNKEQKERQGAPVVRAATTETVQNPPAHMELEQQPQQSPPQSGSSTADMPPSYEQSEEENVRIQVAGRD
ncbi:hypothetical protein TWF694_002737 [Orbilia ellipsospora]|uniref:DUF7330 domain-containing protein n=1 Tax=Orbilia ellipsospora TaxID=2528407 RepID=A0AAV9X431_9PEZI